MFVGAKKYLWMENLEIPPCILVPLMREAPRDKRMRCGCAGHTGACGLLHRMPESLLNISIARPGRENEV